LNGFFFFALKKGKNEDENGNVCLPPSAGWCWNWLMFDPVLYTYTRGRLFGHVFDVVSSKLFASLFVSASFEEKTFGLSRVSDTAKKVRSLLLPDGSFLLLCVHSRTLTQSR
jgi:hypothetical protein